MIQNETRKQETPSQATSVLKFSRRAVSNAKNKIQALLNRISSGGTQNSKGPMSFEDYLPVDGSFVEKARQAGIEIDESYVHSIDDSSIAHTKAHHGTNA